MELIRKLFKKLKRNAGFTLPEVAAVVAITATLAAIIVPVAVDQIEKSRIARAAVDIDAIHGAIQLFFGDTGEWPDRTGTFSPDGIDVLRSGRPGLPNFLTTDEDLLFSSAGSPLFPGIEEGDTPDPMLGYTDWVTYTVLVDELVNHLTLDNPLGSSSFLQSNHVYILSDVNWNGPYMPQIFNDPWGRNYLVYARAFTVPSTEGADLNGDGIIDSIEAFGLDMYVWIISGGPNETLETDVTSPVLNNNPFVDSNGKPLRSTVSDDIGMMVFKAREGISGVTRGGASM